MTPAFAPQAEVALDPTGHIDQDITCIRCGYNLRGLPPQSACPECGTAIGRSIQGDFLRFSPPAWVEQLASGMNWIVASIIVAIFGGVAAAVVAKGVGSDGLRLVLTQALGIVAVVGYWLVTSPDPARVEQEPTLTARRIVRFSKVTNYLLAWLILGLSQVEPMLAGLLALLGGVLGLVEMVAIFVYARQLALRIPNLRLARETYQLMWGWIVLLSLGLVLLVSAVVMGGRPPGGGMGLVGGIGCFLAVGALVAGILTLVVILSYRRQLSAAAMEARATWARTVPEQS